MRYERDGFSIESRIRKKQPLPDWYVNEPVMQSADMFYIKGFYDLNTCRDIGMGLGPIPWRDIVAYASFYRLEEDVTEAFIDIIREMDTVYLEWQSEERKRKEEAGKPKGNKRKK